jgi:hypothetical protein
LVEALALAAATCLLRRPALRAIEFLKREGSRADADSDDSSVRLRENCTVQGDGGAKRGERGVSVCTSARSLFEPGHHGSQLTLVPNLR